MAVHDIVVVGANFAGLGTAHYLLKHTIPALEKANGKSTVYKLTLISPSTHFYFKIGSPRILAKPDLIPFSKAFLPLKDAFKEYPADRFSLVIGEAIELDEENKSITVQDTYTTTARNLTVYYSSLVIATGATANSPLWNLKGSHESTLAALKEMHTSLPKAKTILIAGGGPAGVETAGELATIYTNASITLLSGSTRLLTRLRPAISAAAEAQLNNLSVTVIHKSLKVAQNTTGRSTNTTLHLSDNTSRDVDVYIDATGTRPNSAFLPTHWLTKDGHVRTEDKLTLRGPVPSVYAIGDVAGYSLGNVFDINDAVRPMCSSIYQDLSGRNKPTSKPFKQNTAETQLVPIGPNGGVGAVFGWKLPSFAVKMIKSKDYMIGQAPKTVSGEQFAKA
ncbi:MAG: hypothetical protein LQ344_003216 [Seirophora lacunosa]|nr:MAG: hypothetical protein LQ344_003216 [Seirophora lacunosa]